MPIVPRFPFAFPIDPTADPMAPGAPALLTQPAPGLLTLASGQAGPIAPGVPTPGPLALVDMFGQYGFGAPLPTPSAAPPAGAPTGLPTQPPAGGQGVPPAMAQALAGAGATAPGMPTSRPVTDMFGQFGFGALQPQPQPMARPGGRGAPAARTPEAMLREALGLSQVFGPQAGGDPPRDPRRYAAALQRTEQIAARMLDGPAAPPPGSPAHRDTMTALAYARDRLTPYRQVQVPGSATARTATPDGVPAGAAGDQPPSRDRWPLGLAGYDDGPDGAPFDDDAMRASDFGEPAPDDEPDIGDRWPLGLGGYDDGSDVELFDDDDFDDDLQFVTADDGDGYDMLGVGEDGSAGHVTNQQLDRLNDIAEDVRLNGGRLTDSLAYEIAEFGLSLAPVTGEAISAKDAAIAFRAAYAAWRDDDAAEALKQAAFGGVAGLGAIPGIGELVRWPKATVKFAYRLSRMLRLPNRYLNRFPRTPGGNEAARLAAVRANQHGLPRGFLDRTAEEAFGATAAGSRIPEENYRRGLAAVDLTIERGLDGDFAPIREAMFRADVGDISLHWGLVGDPRKKYRRGFGLSKIIAKHGIESVEPVIRALAYGKRYGPKRLGDERYLQRKQVRVLYGDHEVILSLYRRESPLYRKGRILKKREVRDTFVITGYKYKGPKKKRNIKTDMSQINGPIFFQPSN